MSPFHAAAIFAAGIVAGTINTVVGSGTLFTFPVLLAFGYPPVVANVSNTVGLVPGSVAGAVGYRRELVGQRRRALPLAAASALGGLIGAVLLLSLPASAFKAIVPVFIAIALGADRRCNHVCLGCLTSAAPPRASGPARWAQPRSWPVACTAAISERRRESCCCRSWVCRSTMNCSESTRSRSCWPDWSTWWPGSCSCAWPTSPGCAALLIAVGSTIGGLLGARGGRRLRPAALRAVIVVVGVVAIVRLVV